MDMMTSLGEAVAGVARVAGSSSLEWPPPLPLPLMMRGGMWMEGGDGGREE
jgi:hypothetical protein